MSWKYSSYVPRDLSSSRDSSQLNFGLSHSKPNSSSGDRWTSTLGDSRFFRSSAAPVEHSPVWAKTDAQDGQTSLQRFKERYNSSEEPRREIRQHKKSETKDLGGSRPKRQYGKTLTSLNLNLNLIEGGSENSKFSRKFEKAPNKTKSPLESPKVLYMPSATTKLLSRKYSSDLSPTIASVLAKERFTVNESPDVGEDAITVVTRGTSPTPTTSSVYLRSKRSDYGLEKKVARVRNRGEMANKEVQTEKETSLSRYGAYVESSGRSPWLTYGGSSLKFSGRPTYGSENRLGSSDCRRSVSKEDSESSSTPESPHKSLATKPPTLVKSSPTSSVKDSEKKILGRKSPPGGIRSSLKLDCAKAELAKNPSSPTRLCSPLQCKIVNAETFARPPGGGQSPKVIVDRCPDIIDQAIDDVSSMSESSEEETSSDEETEEPVPVAMTVKKSVTNFLQNIPNHLPQSASRNNLYQKTNVLSTHKVHFSKIESGERAWWLESSDKVPEGIARAKSTRSVPHQDGEGGEIRVAGHLLSPPYLLNRQFTRDIDWLKGSSEDVRKTSESHSPKEDRQSRSPVPSGQGLVNGDAYSKPHLNGNCTSPADAGKDFFNVTLPVRRRDYSKSPENFLTDELSHAMKFNQQSGDYLTDFQRECAVKDITQKLQNSLGSPLEDKTFLEPGDMSGMISKAKAGLLKSKTKLDIKKSSSREMSPKPTDTKSEIDLYWKELADSLNRPLLLCDLDFTDLNSDDETDILGGSKMNGDVPPPPPMLFLPMLAFPAKNPPAPTPPTASSPASPRTRTPVPPPAPQIVKNKKTVKLFWKEVKDEPAMRAKVPEGVTVLWDELAPVKVDTQKLEHLFESRAKDLISKKQQEQNKNKEIIVLDPKRSNAINIGMTKLPPPRSIRTAILKMDATVVNKEGIEKLLTMLPTEEEKLRIQEAQSANPDVPLGSAEQFLSTLASISELEARLRLWAFKLNFENNEKEICEPLMDLKHGMEILRANKTFRGILATLLSVGNFLNGYDVKGFQIEYLSKVPEVKDTVHKHSLLHHLCLIVMEKFPDSTDLYSEIGAVTRASKVDFDELAANIKKVEEECKLSWNYLKMIAKHEGHTAMKVKMSDFLADCAERIIVVGTVHKRIMNRFQKFVFWLGIPMNRISTTRPHEIFKTISEFALEYRTTRDRVLQQIKKINREKSRSRGYASTDVNDVGMKKMNSKEAKDDARLKQLLQDESCYSDGLVNASTWRRQRRDTKNLLLEVNNNDEEILDALIKTANQVTSPRVKERRRSRIYGKH